MPSPPQSGVLLDYARDKIALLDTDGRFTYVNDAAERILGWEPDELIGQTAFAYIHPDDVDRAKSAFERTISSDAFTESTEELRYKTEGGDWVWLESRMSNVTDERLGGYVVSSRDITDRIAAQRDRDRTTERLQELSAATGDVLWMFNGDWSELLFVNPAYEDVYGQPVSELQNPQAFLDAIHPDDVPAVRGAMDCLSAGRAVDMEYRVNSDKNYNVWVWVQGEPIVKDGEVVRITGFSRDITDRYRRERQLCVMDNLLRHNLRNDLTTILGNAEIIESKAPELQDRTAVIRRTGEELLESAEKERDIIEILTSRDSPRPVDLDDLLSAAVETVSDRYPSARVETPVASEITVCAIDELRLAVIEVLENAVVHNDSDDPTVGITVSQTDHRVTMSIEDTATPIPDIDAAVLTGDHDMDDVYHSTGLGLWLTYWIVELSNGQIDVESDPEHGNRVRITLMSGKR